MRLLLALVVLTATATAQTPDSLVVSRPRSGVRADLVLGGVAAGATAVVVGRVLLREAGVSDEAWAFALYPVGVAAGIHALARRQGLEGSLGGAARRTVAGTLVGLAAGYTLAYVGLGATGGPLSKENEAATAAILIASLGAIAVVPAIAATGEYSFPEAAPVVLRMSDGRRVPGLGLRVAL